MVHTNHFELEARFETRINGDSTAFLTFTRALEDDDYVCKTAAKAKEATALIEAGFEYIYKMENVKLFWK